MPYASTDLGRLFVQPLGNGPAVSFWNCLFGDSSIYHKCIEGLRSDHRIVLVEGPSHGQSEPWPRPLTLEQCADAWVQALDQQGIEPPVVFGGLSWGSMVALRVALRHPRWVRGLLLMSTIATLPPRKLRPQFYALAQAVRLVGFPDFLINQMAPQIFAPQSLRERPKLAHDLLARNRKLDRNGLHQAAMAVLVHPADIVDELWRIGAPTLVLVGQNDRTTPPRTAKVVARAIDGAELRLLRGVGHMLTLEAPKEVGEVLREALDAFETGSRP